MIKLRRLLLFIFYFLACLMNTAFAQYEASRKGLNYLHFNHLNENADIANMIADRIYEDANGFIWFSTETGLCRFDGKRKKYFSGRKYGGYEPINASVFSRDNHGNIWLADGNHLLRFNSLTEDFENIHYSLINDEDIDQITALEIRDSMLWIGSPKGVFTANIGDSIKLHRMSFSHNHTSKLETAFNVTCLHVSAANHLWVGTKGRGLYMMTNYKDTDDSLKSLCNNSLCSEDIISVVKYDETHLLVTTSQGLTLMDSKINCRTLLKNKHITATNVSSTGEIWCSTFGDGLFYFENLHTTYENYRYIGNDNSTFDFINTSFVDSHDNLWILLEKLGIRWLNNTYKCIKNYTQLRHRDGLKNNIVKAILVGQDGKQYIGTYEGLSIYDPQAGRYKHVTVSHDSENGNQIESLAWGKNNVLWIGTRNGLYSYQSASAKIKAVKAFSGKIIWKIMPTKRGDGLWIGSDKGLYHFSYNTEALRSIPLLKSDVAEGKSIHVNTVLEDSRNRLWVGTEGKGLFRMDLATYPDSLVAISFLNNGRPSSFNNTHIYSIFEAMDRDVWIGCRNGLFQYSERGGFLDYTSKNARANNIIKSICEDSEQRMWLTTHLGIAVMDPITGNRLNFNTLDGIRCNIFNMGALEITADNQLLAGSLKGVVKLNLVQLMKKEHTFPKQYIHAIYVDNQKIIANRIIHGEVISKVAPQHIKELTLKSDENNLSFIFGSVEMNHPNRIMWAYRVRELDDSWIYLSPNEHDISFFNMPKGKYHLEYRSTNHTGQWNQEAETVVITILPHWSQTSLAYFTYILLALSLFIYLFHYQKRKIKEKESMEHVRELKEQAFHLEKEKNEFFINISHELRKPMSLITTPLQEMTKKKNELTPNETLFYIDIIHKNVQQLSHHIDQLLNLSNIQSGNVHLQLGFHNVSQLTQHTVANFQELATEKNVSLVFSDTTTLGNVVCDRNAVEIILCNLLSNAIKYSAHGGVVRVTISIPTTKNECYCISVQDEGIGMSEEQLKDIFKRYTKRNDPKSNATGIDIGLAYTKSLVDLHRGEIKVESKLNEGSSFSVYLPSKMQHHLYTSHQPESDERTPSATNELAHQAADEFLLKVENYVEKNLASPELSVENLADAMSVSTVHLYRRLKSLADTTPNDFIRNKRMEHATKMLSEGTMNISEIAYAVGFNDPKYFSKCFKMVYGMSPRTYQRTKKA